jgi:hypothetical protein
LIIGGGGRLNDQPIATDVTTVEERDLDSSGRLELLGAATRAGDVLVVTRFDWLARLLVAEHLAEPALLGRAPRKSANRRARDAALAMRRASPMITLQEIGRQLQAMAIPSARGHLTWSASMVAQLLKPTALDAVKH